MLVKKNFKISSITWFSLEKKSIASRCKQTLYAYSSLVLSGNTLKDMLHFLYTGEIQGVETRPTELLHLGTFYRLPDLEMACKEELVRYFFRLRLQGGFLNVNPPKLSNYRIPL
jgi:hypothetical protein